MSRKPIEPKKPVKEYKYNFECNELKSSIEYCDGCDDCDNCGDDGLECECDGCVACPYKEKGPDLSDYSSYHPIKKITLEQLYNNFKNCNLSEVVIIPEYDDDDDDDDYVCNLIIQTIESNEEFAIKMEEYIKSMEEYKIKLNKWQKENTPEKVIKKQKEKKQKQLAQIKEEIVELEELARIKKEKFKELKD